MMHSHFLISQDWNVAASSFVHLPSTGGWDKDCKVPAEGGKWGFNIKHRCSSSLKNARVGAGVVARQTKSSNSSKSSSSILRERKTHARLSSLVSSAKTWPSALPSFTYYPASPVSLLLFSYLNLSTIPVQVEVEEEE